MATSSQAFNRLHPSVQRWIYDQGWTELRDAQEKAIAPILQGSTDLIIAADTAGGKTEAGCLPICSRLLADECAGAAVLYISPLKALINDQSDRMERLCETLNIDVHPWHGDIAQSRKREFVKQPFGILLIPPESLEAIFVNRGSSVPSLFSGLLYVVVDELHCFIGAERGKQLQSLLRRVECSIKRRVPRIALSATLGDMGMAAEFLRPGGGSRVDRIVSGASGQELKLRVCGYRMSATVEGDEAEDENVGEYNDGSARAVAEDLFRVLRGSNNLVFANSRNQVEKYTDLLTQISDSEHLPNEFWAHHGNLSKELREEVEAAVKDKSQPASAICTSTLELGIDIGAVKSIAQIGTPNSVASLRQRLGRSGRKPGDAAILRVYIREREIDERTLLEDCLRFELVQTIAMLSLLLGRWCEPPDASRLHLSTLVQQILSLIAQYGGVTARSAWPIISDAFEIDQQMFTAVLRSLGARRILRQESDGTLLLDEAGEQIVNHYSFYAAFVTPEEYRNSVPGGAHGDWVDLAWHHEGGHVRPELGEEVAHPVHQEERHHRRGEAGDQPDDREAQRHDGEPDELQAPVADPVKPEDPAQIPGHGSDHEDGELDGDRGHCRGARGDQLDDLGRRDRVPVIGIVEQEPGTRRAGQHDQVPAVRQERTQPHRVTQARRGVSVDRPFAEGAYLAERLVATAPHLHLVARRFRHPAAQVYHGGGGHLTELEDRPPGHIVAGSCTEQGQRDERADDEAQGLGGEHHPDQLAAVLTVGVLAHQHGADRVIAAHTEAEQEAERDQYPVRRRQRGSKGPDHHDRRDQPVHAFAAEQVGESAEHEGTEESRRQHRAVQQREPAGTEIPFLLDQGRSDPDDEQVIGVGEEAHPGHQHRPQMESAQLCLVERGQQVRGADLGHRQSSQTRGQARCQGAFAKKLLHSGEPFPTSK